MDHGDEEKDGADKGEVSGGGEVSGSRVSRKRRREEDRAGEEGGGEEEQGAAVKRKRGRGVMRRKSRALRGGGRAGEGQRLGQQRGEGERVFRGHACRVTGAFSRAAFRLTD